MLAPSSTSDGTQRNKHEVSVTSAMMMRRRGCTIVGSFFHERCTTTVVREFASPSLRRNSTARTHARHGHENRHYGRRLLPAGSGKSAGFANVGNMRHDDAHVDNRRNYYYYYFYFFQVSAFASAAAGAAEGYSH